MESNYTMKCLIFNLSADMPHAISWNLLFSKMVLFQIRVSWRGGFPLKRSVRLLASFEGSPFFFFFNGRILILDRLKKREESILALDQTQRIG